MKILTYVGDICAAPADWVCSSTNPHLQLMLGTGGALRDVGGWEIQDECNAIIARESATSGHAYLECGNVAGTGSGKLSFRGIIHCVAIDAFHDSSQDTIRLCVRNALNAISEAETQTDWTVAMPVFASGNGQFDFETSLDTMIRELMNWNKPAPTQVLIVVFDSYRMIIAEDIIRRLTV